MADTNLTERQVEIVWDKDIYKNNFRCSCGNILMKDNQLQNVLFDTTVLKADIICDKCQRTVAYMDGCYSATDIKEIVTAPKSYAVS